MSLGHILDELALFRTPSSARVTSDLVCRVCGSSTVARGTAAGGGRVCTAKHFFGKKSKENFVKDPPLSDDEYWSRGESM